MAHNDAEGRHARLLRGEFFGLLNLAVTALAGVLLLATLYSAWTGIDINDQVVALLLACGILCVVTDVYFMIGMQAYAQSLGRNDLAHTLWMFTGLSFAEYSVLIVAGMAAYTGLFFLAATLFLVALPAIVLNGLFLIQIAEIFWALSESRAEVGIYVGFFQALAGYAMLSIILAPLGSFMFFAAKVYMLALLAGAKDARPLEISEVAVGE